MDKAWLVAVAAIVIAAIGWYVFSRGRRHNDRRELKEQVQAWEDEGGNVPEVPTVSPRAPPPNRRP